MSIIQNLIQARRFLFQPFNAVYLIAWGSILLGYWRGINNHLPVLGTMTDELEWCIVLAPILLSLPKLWKRIKTSDHIFVFACLIYYLLNIQLFPQNADVLVNRLFSFSLLTLPYYYIGVTLDIKRFYNFFYYISVVAVFMCAFYELLYAQSASYTGDVDTSEYNMELAYSILPHVLMVSWRALKRFVLLNIAPMLLGLMLLLSFGTRGPVICAIVFIAIYLLFIRPSKYQKTMRIITVACAVYAMSFLEQFMTFMQLMTFQLGMSTRIFDKYFEGELEDSSGRDYIRETLLRDLSIDNSLFGHGVLGSYPYVNTYPHNIVLEFLFSFGWVWGIAILFCIVYIIAKMLINTHQCEINVTFGIILVIASILKLCFSSTFVDDALFFMLLGYCVNSSRKISI
ncbi:MAG: O-antigen ligase family protein [Prevotella sp.]